VLFSPDGQWLAAKTDWQLVLWDWKHSQVQPRVFGPEPPAMFGGGGGSDSDFRTGQTMDISQGGNQIVFGKNYGDPGQYIWSLLDPTAAPRTLKDGYSGNQTNNLLFSPDGRWLATNPTYSGVALLWDLKSTAATFKELTGNRRMVSALAFSPDNHWLATGHGNDIYLWDLTSADPSSSPRILQGHSMTIWSLAFSPDGRILASGSRDKTIRLWDMTVKNIASSVVVLSGHTADVYDLAFARNGTLLVSNSLDGTTHVWDLNFERMLEMACEQAGRNFTQEEWSLYFDLENYRKTCPQWPQATETTPNQ